MKARKILLTGLGSIGRRHARLLASRGDVELFALRSGHSAGSFNGVKDLFSWDDVMSVSPDIAFITNQTAAHLETAIKCAGMGMHLFIEKPLDTCLERLPELKALVKEKGLTAYVAYNLRFHPGVVDLRTIVASEGFELAEVYCSSWLPDWRPGTEHLKSYSALSALGGGVVLDLSHEPDYAGYIFGEIVGIDGRAARVSTVTVDAEDTADLTLHLKGGQKVAVHVDFCTRGPASRMVKAVTRAASYELDLISGRLITVRDGRREERTYQVDRDATYKAQLDYFFAHLGREHMNGLDEAGNLLKMLLALKRFNGLQ